MRIRSVFLSVVILSVSSTNAANLILANRSWGSIPLNIPGVMNPNLNPKSTSGVTLTRGQQIFFSYKGKQTLLLKIDAEKDGDIIVVDELIAQRREALEKEPK